MVKLSSIGVLANFSFLGKLCLALSIYQPGPPEIRLSGYTQMDSYLGITPNPKFLSKPQFQNDFIIKNGTDYVISEDTRTVQFTCQAEYPIRWNLPNKEEEISYGIFSTTTRTSDFTGNMAEPVNVQFKSVISLYLSVVKFFGTDLTCGSILNSHENLKSSVYIFVKGKDMIENEGRTLVVSLDPKKPNAAQSPLVLPCRPASPDIKLLLEKEMTDFIHIRNNKVISKKTSWSVLTPQANYVTFDPKIGFTLQRGVYGNRIFGMYKCSVLTKPEDLGSMESQKTGEILLINVTMTKATSPSVEKLPEKMSFDSRSIIRGKASVNVDYIPHFKMSLFKCCSGAGNPPPTLLIASCNNPYECEWSKDSALGQLFAIKDNLVKSHNRKLVGLHQIISDCAQEWIHGSITNIVVCKGDNVDFVEEYVNLFHPLASGSVQNRSTRIQKSSNKPVNLKRTTSLTQFVKLSQASMVKVPEKMLIFVAHKIHKARPGSLPVSFSARALVLMDRSGIAQIFGIDKKWRRKPEILGEYSRDVFYEGETLNFICVGARYFYTDVGHIRLNWQNGSKTLLEKKVDEENSPGTIHHLYMVGNADMFSGRGSDAVSVFGSPIKAKIGMTSVDCWMPKRDDTKWDKTSKDLKILPSVAPKFAEPENETVYVYLGDVGNFVTCNMIEGLPLPWLTVLKNGQRAKLTVDGSNTSWHESLRGIADGWHNVTGTLKEGKKSVKIHLDMGVTEHHHQMEFKCIAKNVNGTVTRTVNIFVIERPGIAVPISSSILGVTALIVAALGGKRWYDRRKLNGPVGIIT